MRNNDRASQFIFDERKLDTIELYAPASGRFTNRQAMHVLLHMPKSEVLRDPQFLRFFYLLGSIPTPLFR